MPRPGPGLYRLGVRSKADAQCTATGRATGERCRLSAIHGSTVCHKHGGSAPQVRAAAARRLQKQLDDILDPNRVLEEIACIAFVDPADVYDDKGNLLPVRKWPESARRALAGFEVAQRNITAGDGHVDTVLKAKFWDKGRALEMAAKKHALLTEKVEITDGDAVLERLVAGRKRVAAARG